MKQLITNAVIVNGDGVSEPFAGDVLIVDDVISRLGSVSKSDAEGVDRRIDAGGRVIAPSFVDTHNHGALGGTKIGDHGIPRTCELAIRGGVTKRICGVDGLSPIPVHPQDRDAYAEVLAPLDGRIPLDANWLSNRENKPRAPADAQASNPSADGAETMEWPWSTTAEFLKWHKGRSITDMGLHLGHSSVRRMVMGNLNQTANNAQLREMAAVVRAEAPFTLGLSTGLVYNPAVYSDKREITTLIRAFNTVKPAALYPHLRSESYEILESLDEVITAAVDGGGTYCNEHTKIAGEHNWDKFNDVETMLDDAIDNASAIENMYPWPAGSTTGDVIFPPEIRAGTREQFLARLATPSIRNAIYRRMRHDTKNWDNFVAFCSGLEGIQISGVGNNDQENFVGKRLADVARAAGHDDLNSQAAFEAVFDFFIANKGDVNIISHYGNDVIVERFFRRPTMSVCTDGLVPGKGQKPHPRSLGAFPKALRLARQLEIPLKEIVYRLSVMPAVFMGLPSPALQVGADASLVMFDFDTVRELNDFDNPLIPPTGIDGVWVHGDLINDHGTIKIPSEFNGRHLLTPVTGPK